MPIYTYKCSKCGSTVDVYRQLRDRLEPEVCSCGGVGDFILDFRPKLKDLYPYVDEYMDHKPVVINSRKHYKQELAKRNLFETGRRRGMKGQWV